MPLSAIALFVAIVVKVFQDRWQWWSPSDTTDWWLPRVFRGGDEFGNPSVGFVAPPLGCFVIFYRPGPQSRTLLDEEGWG